MSASTATGAELVAPSRSHWISCDWQQNHAAGGRGFGPVREEVHPIAEVTWRGERYRLELEARRYLASSGWSPWQVIARRAFVPFPSDDLKLTGTESTELARQRMAAEAAPLVLEWLESDDYTVSRQRTIAQAVYNELRDTRSSSDDRATQLLANVRDELRPQDLERISEAAETLARFFELVGA